MHRQPDEACAAGRWAIALGLERSKEEPGGLRACARVIHVAGGERIQEAVDASEDDLRIAAGEKYGRLAGGGVE